MEKEKKIAWLTIFHDCCTVNFNIVMLLKMHLNMHVTLVVDSQWVCIVHIELQYFDLLCC